MKRRKTAIASALLGVFLISAAAYAQTAPVWTDRDSRLQLQVQELLQGFQGQVGQRTGGGRGGLTAVRIGPVPNTAAWWTDSAMVERLGLTADQKAKIERAFENHRQQIVASSESLEKEEAQLAKLLGADSIDRNAVLAEIDRVVQARGEVERANSAMTLEMREYLTRAQWLQLHPDRTRVGPAILASNIASQVDPVYTGIQGTVVLEVEISREGAVENVRVISGPPQLTQAAVDAVKQWRYKPVSLNGSAVAVIGTVNVNFPFTAGGGRGERGTPAGGPGQRRGPGQQ